MSHICTTESLLAGGVEIKSKCLICRKVTKHKIGYVVSKCTECGNDYNDHLGNTVRKRREYLGLTKNEIAQLYGVRRSTITRYEQWPCEKYWNWILDDRRKLN